MLKLYKFKEFLSEKYFKTDVGTRFDSTHSLEERTGSKRKAIQLHYQKMMDLHYRLKNHYGQPDEKELPHIDRYRRDSTPLNSYLHERHASKESSKDIVHEKHSENLSNYLNKKEAPETFHVYSGLKEDPRNGHYATKDVKEEGDHFKAHLPAFTSTSIDPKITIPFTRTHSSFEANSSWDNSPKDVHILKLEIPKGSKHGGYVNYDSIGEKEFLIDKGKNIHISKKPQIIRKQYEGSNSTINTHIWHAKIVN